MTQLVEGLGDSIVGPGRLQQTLRITIEEEREDVLDGEGRPRVGDGAGDELLGPVADEGANCFARDGRRPGSGQSHGVVRGLGQVGHRVDESAVEVEDDETDRHQCLLRLRMQQSTR